MPQLRLITGGLDQVFTINGIRLRPAALERQLPAIDALVVEQDCGLLLDEHVEIQPGRDAGTTPSSILLEQEYRYPPGTVLRKQGKPERLQMVIHDLEHQPNWSPQGVEQALNALFSLLPRYVIDSIAMPAPAHRHGGLAIAPSITLLCDYLIQHSLPWRGELWLLLPRSELQTALAILHTLCDSRRPE